MQNITVDLLKYFRNYSYLFDEDMNACATQIDEDS